MKLLLTTVSALAVAGAIPAFAADIGVPVQFPEEYFEGNKAAGYVDLHYGFVDGLDQSFLGGDGDPDVRTAGVYARGNLPFSETSLFNLQLDGTADAIFDVNGGGPTRGTPIEATAHLYIRDPTSYALGVFGSYGVINGLNMWGGGAEGQLLLDRLTLYGQAGYRSVETTSFSEWYVRGIGRWFPTDNIRLEGEIGFAQYSNLGMSINQPFWSATAEYRFDHMPLGVYGQYRGYYVDSADLTFHAFLLGVRGHLGSDSLFDNDRHGASLDTWVPLPAAYGLVGPVFKE